MGTLGVMTEDESKRYLCGLFDGEGSICAWKNGRQWSVYTSVGMTAEEPLILMRDTWGGRLYEKGATCKTRNGYTMWAWSIGTADSIPFLEYLAVHAIVKREQAISALPIARMIAANRYSRNPLSDEDRALRHELALRLKSLNGARARWPTFSVPL